MRTTLDLPDNVFRKLKARAAMEGLSLKDLVARYIKSGLSGTRVDGHDGEERARRLERLWAEGAGHSGGARFTRDETYADRVR